MNLWASGLRETVLRCVVIALASLLVGHVSIPDAEAGPMTWVLTETSCYSADGGCVNIFGPLSPVTLPLAIAWLELPDINFSGSATLDCTISHCTPFYSGGFSLLWTSDADVFDIPGGGLLSCTQGLGLSLCALDIIFASSKQDGLSISIFEQDAVDDYSVMLSGTDTSTLGFYGSDGVLLGCGTDAACKITGVWTVPEPSSLVMLFSALGLFWIARRRASTPRAYLTAAWQVNLARNATAFPTGALRVRDECSGLARTPCVFRLRQPAG
jgi:hypothetical protein